MATDTQRTRFRRAVGDPGNDPGVDTPLFESDEIDDLFAEAGEVYPTGNDEALMAYAVIQGFHSLLALYAQQVNYTANSASESLGQVSDHYEKLIQRWEQKLNDALLENAPMALWGSTSVTPRRDKDYPNA